jgi:hypothetical protein
LRNNAENIYIDVTAKAQQATPSNSLDQDTRSVASQPRGTSIYLMKYEPLGIHGVMEETLTYCTVILMMNTQQRCQPLSEHYIQPSCYTAQKPILASFCHSPFINQVNLVAPGRKQFDLKSKIFSNR